MTFNFSHCACAAAHSLRGHPSRRLALFGQTRLPQTGTYAGNCYRMRCDCRHTAHACAYDSCCWKIQLYKGLKLSDETTHTWPLRKSSPNTSLPFSSGNCGRPSMMHILTYHEQQRKHDAQSCGRTKMAWCCCALATGSILLCKTLTMPSHSEAAGSLQSWTSKNAGELAEGVCPSPCIVLLAAVGSLPYAAGQISLTVSPSVVLSAGAGWKRACSNAASVAASGWTTNVHWGETTTSACYIKKI